jgi:ABC transport system ATP-binding/permease protein
MTVHRADTTDSMLGNVIVVDSAPLDVGRDAACDLRIPDPSVSRRHVRLRRVGHDLHVEDLGSTLGTFVNGQRVRAKTARDGDLVRLGRLTFRWDGRSLRPVRGGLAVRLGTVSVSAASRVLVRDVSFEVGPGRFVGLLGPSGAGKSTLLRGIAGLVEVDGVLLLDGERRDAGGRDRSRAEVGFVPQDDVVYGTLTVRENLLFAARIRLGTDDVGADVARVLDEVDLAEHADKLASVLSGGQRKRLSVGIELLRRPRLLLLDEPTSGLDPATECRLMEGLRHLSRQGTTVLCTTHVLDNSHLFDDVGLLGLHDGVGRLAYYGPPSAILGSFSRRAMADVYEACATGDFEPWPAGFERTPASEQETPRVAPDAPVTESTTESSSRRLLGLLVRRHLLAAYRDRQAVVAMVLQPVLLALLIDVTQFSPGKLSPVTFFTVVVALWLGLNNSARELVRERAHCVRDRLGGVPAPILLAAKVLAFLAIGLAQVVLLWTVVRLGEALAMAIDDVGRRHGDSPPGNRGLQRSPRRRQVRSTRRRGRPLAADVRPGDRRPPRSALPVRRGAPRLRPR